MYNSRMIYPICIREQLQNLLCASMVKNYKLCMLWLHLINIPLKEIIETTIIGAFISLLIMIDGGPATIVIIIVYYISIVYVCLVGRHFFHIMGVHQLVFLAALNGVTC